VRFLLARAAGACGGALPPPCAPRRGSPTGHVGRGRAPHPPTPARPPPPPRPPSDTSAPIPHLIYTLAWVPAACDALVRALLPPPLYLMKFRILGYFHTRITATVAELGIADALVEAPKTAAQLAHELACDEAYLFRLLRAAVQANLFTATKGTAAAGRTLFSNNALSSALRVDHPNTVRHMAIHQGAEMERAWQHLAHTVRTGKPAFQKAHGGEELFDYLRVRPAVEDTFSKAMSEVNNLSAKACIADYYARGRHARVVDVGGAHGAFLGAILRALPASTRGLLFDQPQVIQRAKAEWAEGGELVPLADRVSFVGGSFFDAATLPRFADGDVVNMRLILHDWSDEDSVKILTNLRTAIGAKRVTVALVEVCVPDAATDPTYCRAFFDLHMMCALAAKERTAGEWGRLLEGCGFRLNRVVPTRGLFSVMEAVPV